MAELFSNSVSSALSGQVALRLSLRGEEISDLRASAVAFLFSDGVDVALCGFAIALVSSIFAMQMEQWRSRPEPA